MTVRSAARWNLEDAPLSSLGSVSHASWLPLGLPQRSRQLTTQHPFTKILLSVRFTRTEAATSPLKRRSELTSS